MIKYRTNESYGKRIGTKFRDFRPEFMLDEKTNELVVVGEIDIQAQIQSNSSCALDKILEKYNYDELIYGNVDNKVIIDDEVVDLTLHPDLADLADYKENVREWKAKLGLPIETSDSDLFKAMQGKADELNAYLEKNIKKEEVKEKNA